ncbi:MAG: class I SAM-dependent methyltransferase [Acidimicrobiales bacterium]
MLTVDYDTLGLNLGERVLDLGCGGGRHVFESLRRGATVVALDYSFEELRNVMATEAVLMDEGVDVRGGVVRGDALGLPFADASFDRVIAAEVLEHIPADGQAMSELARVLRPGGVIAVTVPRFGPELINWSLSDAYHAVEGGHIRIYRRSQLVQRLNRAGLRPFASHHAHGLHSPYWWLKCLVGVKRDHHRLVQAYHRLLVWDITDAPAVTRLADRVLSPLMGKSFVIYLKKAA